MPFATVCWLVCCFVLQNIWADLKKKIKHSHVEYGHVHNTLSRHYKDCQMVANVQESTSTNINLDVIECTKQSADTPAWVYIVCTCVGHVGHSIVCTTIGMSAFCQRELLWVSNRTDRGCGWVLPKSTAMFLIHKTLFSCAVAHRASQLICQSH